jgi:hypothetical protein
MRLKLLFLLLAVIVVASNLAGWKWGMPAK